MIHKPGKPKDQPSSYRPISLLSNLSKVLEKLILKRIIPIFNAVHILPDHQFGFRAQHSTIQQCHRIVDKISASLEQKKYCTAAFLDIAQAFDRVWHPGLLFKLKNILLHQLYLLLESYLDERYFQVTINLEKSNYQLIKAGVPQGSILGPLLYTAYTADMPIHPHTTLFTYADDTAILSSHENPEEASRYLQEHLELIQRWAKNWKIKLNESKCIQINFTLRRGICPAVCVNETPLPTADVVKYLGIHMDKRLTWNPHTKIKRVETMRRYKILSRLLDYRSKLTLENKILLYKTIIRPMWSYGLEIWGSAKKTNIERFQTLQSIILRKITNAPFYVSNETLHNDLNILYVKDYIANRYNKFHAKLSLHINPLVEEMSSRFIPNNPQRRLKRRWPRDLLTTN